MAELYDMNRMMSYQKYYYNSLNVCTLSTPLTLCCLSLSNEHNICSSYAGCVSVDVVSLSMAMWECENVEMWIRNGSGIWMQHIFIYIKPIKSTSKNNFNYYLVCISVVFPSRTHTTLPNGKLNRQISFDICKHQFGYNNWWQWE